MTRAMTPAATTRTGTSGRTRPVPGSACGGRSAGSSSGSASGARSGTSTPCQSITWTRDHGPRSEVALLLDLGPLPDAVTQVVQLGPAHVAPGHPIELGPGW